MTGFARLAAVFDDLVALPPDARTGRLAELGDAEPDFAAALARMLAEFDAGTSEGFVDAARRLGIDSGESGIPAQIGTWSIERELGRGGMGVVYAAHRDAGGVRQQAALKWLKRGLDTDAMLRRFARERRILAMLAHPGIARFIDGGSEQGRPWFAMERVEGAPISVHAERARLDLDARLGLLVDACNAIDHAHRHLVLHRDIKPSNVFVDGDGRVHVLDFGIAKLLGGDDDDALDTATAGRVLTPAYAAPEQLRGEPATTATDVFGLGLLAFEVLTGRHARAPASGPTGPAALEGIPSASALLRARGSRVTRSLALDIDAVLDKATASDPSRRHGSARELAADFVALRERRPVSARRPGPWQAARAFARRHRTGVAVTAATLAALSLGLSLALWQAHLAREAAAAAQTARLEAEKNAQRASASAHFFANTIGRIDQLVIARGRDVSVADWIRAGLERVDAQLGEQPEVGALVRASMGAALATLGDYEGGRAALRVAIPHMPDAGETDRAALANALNALGQAENRLGDQAAAAAALDRALQILDGLPAEEPHTRTRMSVRTSLLTLRSQLGDYEAALAVGEENLRERQAAFGIGSPQTAVDHYNIASTLTLVGDDRAALTHYQNAAQALGNGPESARARLAWIETGRAGSLRRLGDLDGTARHIEAAEAIIASHFAPPHEAYASNAMVRGQLFQSRGDLAAAGAQFAAAEATFRALGLGARSRALSLLAWVALDRGDIAAARAHIDAALAERPALAELPEFGAIRWRAQRARLLAAEGDSAAGRAALRAAMADWQRHPRHPADEVAHMRRWLDAMAD